MAKPSFNGESDPEISDPVKKLRPDPIHSTIPWFFSVWNLDILVKQSKQSTRLDAMNGGDGGEFLQVRMVVIWVTSLFFMVDKLAKFGHGPMDLSWIFWCPLG